MQLQAREEYRGPGQSDPTKTRAERARQLAELLETPAGREIIVYYFGRYTGTREAACPPAGLLMIQTVLRHEYPST
jgi:hypothetical protein